MPARLYATPGYIERIGNPKLPDDLRRADFISIDSTGMFLKGLNALGLNLTERNFPILTENYLVMWEMVKHGLGIGVMDGTIGDREPLAAKEALRTIAAFRLALPRTILRYAGGREITLGDLGTEQGLLGGINAVIVGNYLTTLGRPATADLELLDKLSMPVKALSATL